MNSAYQELRVPDSAKLLRLAEQVLVDTTSEADGGGIIEDGFAAIHAALVRIAARADDDPPATARERHARAVVVLCTTAVLSALHVRPFVAVAPKVEWVFAGSLAHAIGAMNGFAFDFDPAADEWACEWHNAPADPPELRRWLARKLGESDTSEPQLFARLLRRDEPIRVFVALPLTGCDFRSVMSSCEVSASIADACQSLSKGAGPVEVRVYQPSWANLFNPEGARAIFGIDIAEIRASDLVVLFHPCSATGLGVVLSHAVWAGAVTVVLRPEGRPISPLVTGHAGDVEILDYSCLHGEMDADAVEDALLALHGFIARRRTDIQARRKQRIARRSAWIKTWTRVKSRFDGPRGSRGLTAWSADLVATVLRDESGLAAAPADLFVALTADDPAGVTTSRPADVPGRFLDPPEYEAAFVAARQAAWTDIELSRVLRYVTQSMALDKRRGAFRKKSDWLSAARQLGI